MPTAEEVPVIELDRREIDQAERHVDPDLRAHLQQSRERVEAFARAQRSTLSDLEVEFAPGVVAGHRLVPGGMTKAAPTLHRDPEAIRARLAAHAAGVARGRTMATSPASAAAATAPTDPVEDVTP